MTTSTLTPTEVKDAALADLRRLKADLDAAVAGARDVRADAITQAHRKARKAAEVAAREAREERAAAVRAARVEARERIEAAREALEAFVADPRLRGATNAEVGEATGLRASAVKNLKARSRQASQ